MPRTIDTAAPATRIPTRRAVRRARGIAVALVASVMSAPSRAHRTRPAARARRGYAPDVPAFLDPALLAANDALLAGWERFVRRATVGPRSARARRFRAFGEGSAICVPFAALYGEEFIELGADCIVGPYATLSAGVMPGHVPDHIPVVTIGDRCLIGK